MDLNILSHVTLRLPFKYHDTGICEYGIESRSIHSMRIRVCVQVPVFTIDLNYAKSYSRYLKGMFCIPCAIEVEFAFAAHLSFEELPLYLGHRWYSYRGAEAYMHRLQEFLGVDA